MFDVQPICEFDLHHNQVHKFIQRRKTSEKTSKIIKSHKMQPKKCKIISYNFYSNTMILLNLTVILALINLNYAFNISPHPNIIVREPTNSKIFMPKIRSSYFGFSLNLKKDRWANIDYSILLIIFNFNTQTISYRWSNVCFIYFIIILMMPEFLFCWWHEYLYENVKCVLILFFL